jgi:NitT/TauT family transport system substrate-binding protein
MRRAEAVAGIAALGASSLVPGRVAAQPATKVRVTTVPIDEGAQSYYAAELGLFAKHGLDADVQSLTNGNDIISAIVGGAVEIGNSNVMTAANAHAHGLPIQMLGEGGMSSSQAPTAYILVALASPIKTAKDLNDKTIGVNSLKSITQISVLNWVDANGGDSKTMKFVDMPFPSMEAVLVGGHVDAALLPEPIATAVLSRGQTRALAAPFDAIAHRFAIGAWVAKPDWVAANPQAVRAFNDVMRETARWANDPANHEQSAAMLLKYTKIRVGKANRVLYGEHLIAGDIQPQINVAARYGVLTSAFRATDMFAPPGMRE